MRAWLVVIAGAALASSFSVQPAVAGGRRVGGAIPARARPPAPDAPTAPEVPTAEEETPAPRRDWLTRHQSPGGGWHPGAFDVMCEGARCDGASGGGGEAGATGIAVLTYLEYGETHRTPLYGDVVRAGLRRLKQLQSDDGGFTLRGSDRFVEEHAKATLAMAEAWCRTESPFFKGSAVQGVAFLLALRNPDGGWRLDDREPRSDAAATAWALSALDAARKGGLAAGGADLRSTLAFLDGIEPLGPGRATAAAVWARILAQGPDASEDPAIARGIALLLASPPRPDAPEAVEPEHLYFSTRACRAVGGEAWRTWNSSLKRAVIDTQLMDKSSCRYGSWDPVSGSPAGRGRMETTALSIHVIVQYYSYSRCFCNRGQR